ncbi:helix-turn-helix transcriptional regulator [Burkholderia plantarii]|uniref:helix-turn-helix transcriptional regulator n=1 Tax=Burkholderia plantarii TaxID=41899 RepID=UPI000870A401|nr:AlpA family phage regulatory protein [Burkholderia plantarii]
MDRQIVRLQGVLEQIGVKKTTLYRWIRKGAFPGPVRLGERSVGWFQCDVSRWIDSRQPTRNQGAETKGDAR